MIQKTIIIIVITVMVSIGTFSFYFIDDMSKAATEQISTKIAFIGDQGSSQNSIAVLHLIKSENVDLVLHQGDFDYSHNPKSWDSRITSILGSDFPYIASIGNHDVPIWEEYRRLLEDRLLRTPNVNCSGDLGVKSSCTFQNLFIVLSGVGTMGAEHDLYIYEQLSSNDYVWKICSWHKNMNKMQLGTKSDETGWEVYNECLKYGAIIATAHEHSYARTKTLSNIENQIVNSNWTDPNNLLVDEGNTFVFVSGISGKSIRNQERCLPFDYPYGCNEEWAKIYTSDQNAKSGALFCTFGVENQANKAFCYFKNVDNEIIDEFYVTSFVGKQDK